MRYFCSGNIEIRHGDCITEMQSMEENRFSSIVTDPPYGLSFMGKAWDHGVPGSPFWTEALRVCKPGAMLLAFGGTRTFHRLTCAIEDAGWEIRDCIMWVYGSGFPKSLDIAKAIDKSEGAIRECTRPGTVQRDGYGEDWDTGSSSSRPRFDSPVTDLAKRWMGWGTALKPAWEPIIVAMKPPDGTFAENAKKHEVAGINIDSSRITAPDGVPVFNQKSERSVNCLGSGLNGSSRTGDIDTSTGRWPANLIHDGSDEVLETFPDAPRQLADLKFGGDHPTGNCYSPRKRVNKPSYNDENEGNVGFKMKPGARRTDSGSAARFFYCAKASRSDRGLSNNHPTVKPSALMEYLIRLISPPTGGEILDPFGGSMTTLVSAQRCGVSAVGIDIEESHCAIGASRLGKPKRMPPRWTIPVPL